MSQLAFSFCSFCSFSPSPFLSSLFYSFLPSLLPLSLPCTYPPNIHLLHIPDPHDHQTQRWGRSILSFGCSLWNLPLWDEFRVSKHNQRNNYKQGLLNITLFCGNIFTFLKETRYYLGSSQFRSRYIWNGVDDPLEVSNHRVQAIIRILVRL